MDSLEHQEVTFDLVDGVLWVEAPLGALGAAQRHELAAWRDDVEHLVRADLGPYEPMVAGVAAAVQRSFGEAARWAP